MNAGASRIHGRKAADFLRRLAGGGSSASAGPVHIRSHGDTWHLLVLFVIASMPAAFVGMLYAGDTWLSLIGSADGPVAGWRVTLLSAAGLAASGSVLNATAAGLLLLLPLLLAAMIASIGWEILFATKRKRPVDPGWLMSSWLFVLLLPPETPLLFAVIGMSFGSIFGSLVFGGTGRYIVSPAVAGALFVHFAYPAILEVDSTWSVVAGIGTAAAVDQGITWWQVFLGRESGLLGTPSALACIAGAVLLISSGVASWRTLGGGLLGLLLAATVATGSSDTPPLFWQFALGNFAFCWAFLLTDPTTMPLTRAGRWVHGAVFGALVIVMRSADPTHPEASLFAVMIAALLVPMIDYIALRAYRWRHGSGLGIRT